jgi:hypothetical protein
MEYSVVGCDGTITWGTANLSLQHINGNAAPVKLGPGQEVPAGEANCVSLVFKICTEWYVLMHMLAHVGRTYVGGCLYSFGVLCWQHHLGHCQSELAAHQWGGSASQAGPWAGGACRYVCLALC